MARQVTVSKITHAVSSPSHTSYFGNLLEQKGLLLTGVITALPSLLTKAL